MKNGDVKQRGRKAEVPIPTIIVYGLDTPKAKKYISVVEGIIFEDIVSSSRRKPIIPNNYTIFDVGIGESFITRYTEQYSVEKLTEL
jgi:hypothetical protein